MLPPSPPEEAIMSADAIVCGEHLHFAPAEPGEEALDGLKYRIYDKLTQQLDLAEVRRLSEEQRRAELRRIAARFLAAEDALLPAHLRERLLDEVLDELVGLGPLDRLLREPDGGDILVNGPHD